MASRALRGLSEPDVRGLLGQGAAPRVSLPSFLLISETPDWRALVCLLRVRQGGFCIVAPLVDSVVEAFGFIEEAAEGAAVVLTERQMLLETTRRRLLANLLCSWPTCRGAAWSTSAGPAASGCRRAGRRVSGHRWSTGCCFGLRCSGHLALRGRGRRPHAGLCDRDGVARSRCRGRGPRRPQHVGTGSGAAGVGASMDQDVAALRARIAELEASQPLHRSASTRPFLVADDAAGLGQLEDRAHRPSDFSCGPIAPPPGLANPYASATSASTGGFHHSCSSGRLGQRSRQLRRRSAGTYGAGGLHQATGQPRGDCIGHPPECLHGAGDSSRTLEGAPPGLMRDFLEKRVALSDHRTLAYFATFLSFGWQEARMTANTHLEAFCAKGLMAVEQMTLDGGRQAVGWLLTGYPEPHWNSFVKQPGRRR